MVCIVHLSLQAPLGEAHSPMVDCYSLARVKLGARVERKGGLQRFSSLELKKSPDEERQNLSLLLCVHS